MNSVEFSNKLLETMSVIAQNAITNEKITKVIDAKVVKMKDSSVGLYTVNYENQILEAYSNNLSVKYKTDDIVYVLCKDGSLDGSLVIVGSKNPYSGLYDTSNEETRYIKVGESLLIFNNNNQVELSTYEAGEYPIPSYSSSGSEYANVFNSYLEKYKTFCFELNIRTDIVDKYRRAKGNYGIKVNLPFVKEDGTTYEQEFGFDINQINGDPYNLTAPSLQRFYIQIEDGLKVNKGKQPTFNAFVNNFDENEKPLNPEPDIFFSDIQFYPVDVLSESALAGYYLKIEASEGNFFMPKLKATKTLTPALLVRGDEVPIEGYTCSWFRENAAISQTSSDKYNAIAGPGWEELQEDKEKTTLEISKSEVKTSTLYKVVINYNGNFVSQTIKIENLESKIELRLETQSGIIIDNIGKVYVNAFVIYKEGTDKGENESLTYDFARYDSKGNRLSSDDFEYKILNERTVTEEGDVSYRTQICFDTSIIKNGSNVIQCSFNLLKQNGVKEQIGVAKKAIITVPSTTLYLQMENGNYLYKYDADGDSPLSKAYDGSDGSRLLAIKPLNFKLFKKDGTELDESEYAYCKVTWQLPKRNSSMMKFDIPEGVETYTSNDGKYDVVVGTGRFDIPYTIDNKFNAEYNNNTVILTVQFGEDITNVNSNLIFTKDGELGSNGTKYIAKIVYNGYNYNAINTGGIPNKFQLAWLAGENKWYRKDPVSNRLLPSEFTGVYLNREEGFQVKLYKDGEEAVNGVNISPDWAIFDSSNTHLFSIIDKSVLVTTSGWVDSQVTPVCILEATVNVTFDDGETIQIIDYYPIELTYFSNTLDIPKENIVLPFIQEGYNVVLFNPDGTSPKYDGSNVFKITDGLYNDDIADVYDYEWSTSEVLNGGAVVKDEEGKAIENSCRISVKSKKFDNANSQNYVRVNLTGSQSRKSQIQNKINTLEQERDDLNDEKVRRQAIKTALEGISNAYDIQAWYDKLKASQIMAERGMALEKFSEIENSKIFLNREVTEYLRISDEDYNEVKTNFDQDVKDAKEAVKELLFDDEKTLGGLPGIMYFEKADTPTTTWAITLAGESETLDEKAAYEPIVQSLYDVNDLTKKYNDVIERLKSLINSGGEEQLNELQGVYTDIVNFTQLPEWQTLKTEDAENFASIVENFDVVLQRIQNTTTAEQYIRALSVIENNLKGYINTQKQLQPNVYKKYDTDELQLQIDDFDVRLKDLEDVYTSYQLSTYVHVKPIICIMNRYGLSYLNDWDGSKIEINENGDRILTPLIGAGRKEKDNSYTGLLMGVANLGGEDKVGLIGLSRGRQSIFMDAYTGKTELGISGGGQIILDPNQGQDGKAKAILKSSDYSTSAGTGMMIDLSTPEIRFGSGNFVVNKDGHAIVKGGGDIAGWKINSTTLESANGTIILDSVVPKIYSNKHKTLNSDKEGFYLGQDGVSIGRYFSYTNDNKKLMLGYGDKKWEIAVTLDNETNSYFAYGGTTALDDYKRDSVYIGTDGIRLGEKFMVNAEGELELGELDRTKGDKWKIGTRKVGNKTYSYFWFGDVEPDFNTPTGTIYIGTDGISLSKDFSVTANGSLTAKEGKIASFTLKKTSLYTGEKKSLDEEKEGVYLGEQGIALGLAGKFKVTKTGELTATKGKIGGWTITDSTLSASSSTSGSITLSAEGEINGGSTLYSWHLGQDGTISANKLMASGGEIGGFTLGGGALYTNGKLSMDTPGNGVYLGSDGIAIGDGFSVDDTGSLFANSGTIGGITLDSTGLKKLNGSGGSFSISNTGTITCSNLICSGGSIGGITINSNGITGEGFSLGASSSTIGGFTITTNAIMGDYAGIYSSTGEVRGVRIIADPHGGQGDGSVTCSLVNIGNETFVPVTLTYLDDRYGPAKTIRVLAVQS